MCGIASLFAYSSNAPDVSQEELIAIRDQMRFRGPDGKGLWISSSSRVGLAHRRLSIIDLSTAGSQPMSTKDGRLVIVFNGEIYNYRQLRTELEQLGHKFYSNSDTEVLLHLYRAYQFDMFNRIRGMYAFAIWDEDRKGLLIARDPLGIKPIYFSDDGATLRVASQVKALLAGGKIDTTPEAAGHVGYYLWGSVPDPFTLYRGIKALPAGHFRWTDVSGSIEKEFCSFPISLENVEEDIGVRDLHECLHDVLLASVKDHLVSDVPVGLFLSSGIDSSTLAALASEIPGTNLKSLTLGFLEYKGTPDDEVPLAESIASMYSCNHETRWVSQAHFLQCLPKIFEAMDQPSIDGINTYLVSEAAAASGLKVALSGLGADELFGGYPSFRQIPGFVQRTSLLSQIPQFGIGFRKISAKILNRFTSPKYAGIFEYGGSYAGAYLLRRSIRMPWELPEVLDPDIVKEGWAKLRTIPALIQTTEGLNNAHLRVAALESSWYMRNQLLRDTDWASMAHSLEIRVPFADYKVYAKTAALIRRAKALTKRDFTRGLKFPLPTKVVNRRKTGFSVPIRQWHLQNSGENAERGLRGWQSRVYHQFVK